MAEATIPVNLLNPGQVFACLGFLEAADVLLGDAEGKFDWADETNVRFLLHALGAENPFQVVLGFLKEAKIRRCAPTGYREKPSKGNHSTKEADEEDKAEPFELVITECFPKRHGEPMALPIRLESDANLSMSIGHWADGSSRKDFKLYAGNRSAAKIAWDMLRGTRKKPGKKQKVGDLITKGVADLWEQAAGDLVANPLNVLTPLGGTFNFDARKNWTTIDAGYSPDKQKHKLGASPVVEILAALGLEHARPRVDGHLTRYGAWGGFLPPILARPALAGSEVGVPVRRFSFTLGKSGENRIATFAQEEENL